MRSTNTGRTGQASEITQLSTNVASDAIYVGGWDKARIEVTLAAGTGTATYKFQTASTKGGDKADLLLSGTATVTQTATGVFTDVVDLSAAEELYIVPIDITTGSYTLDAKVIPFS